MKYCIVLCSLEVSSYTTQRGVKAELVLEAVLWSRTDCSADSRLVQHEVGTVDPGDGAVSPEILDILLRPHPAPRQRHSRENGGDQ